MSNKAKDGRVERPKSPVLVDSTEFSFQADGNLKNSNGDVQVQDGARYHCCVSQSTTDVGTVFCHYANFHGLDDLSDLRFHCDKIGFVWTLYPHTVNMGQDKTLEDFKGATVIVSQNNLTDHTLLWVKAGEQLFCTNNSGERVLCVKDGMLYSGLMLKNQRFSSLFRHYAKFHHLIEDDLEYRFNDVLIDAKDTPTTIHVDMDDTIIVRTKRKRTGEEAS